MRIFAGESKVTFCRNQERNEKYINATFRSLPEYPSVILDIASKSTSSAKSSFAKMTLRIFSLFGATGKLTINLHKKKRKKKDLH